jgi:hypothetical protein
MTREQHMTIEERDGHKRENRCRQSYYHYLNTISWWWFGYKTMPYDEFRTSYLEWEANPSAWPTKAANRGETPTE